MYIEWKKETRTEKACVLFDKYSHNGDCYYSKKANERVRNKLKSEECVIVR